MNNTYKNISSYFDEDFINIIYKDLKSANITFNEDDLNSSIRENIDNEIHIFDLNTYKFGSIGFNSKELEDKKIDFTTFKHLSNDYNGPEPSYEIAFVKLLFSRDNGEILGFQIANTKNIEKRLEAVKILMDNKMGIKDLAKARIYGDSDINPDILNIAALMGLNKISKTTLEVNEIEVSEVGDLLKNGAYFLDVREEDELELGHIKGAVHIPLRNLVAELSSIPKDKNVYVYCRTGHRSLDAVTFLKSLGVENSYNLKGGFVELSLNEFRKDKGNIENSILTNYNFE